MNDFLQNVVHAIAGHPQPSVGGKGNQSGGLIGLLNQLVTTHAKQSQAPTQSVSPRDVGIRSFLNSSLGHLDNNSPYGDYGLPQNMMSAPVPLGGGVDSQPVSRTNELPNWPALQHYYSKNPPIVSPMPTVKPDVASTLT